jgi:hypothetical protein
MCSTNIKIIQLISTDFMVCYVGFTFTHLLLVHEIIPHTLKKDPVSRKLAYFSNYNITLKYHDHILHYQHNLFQSSTKACILHNQGVKMAINALNKRKSI